MLIKALSTEVKYESCASTVNGALSPEITMSKCDLIEASAKVQARRLFFSMLRPEVNFTNHPGIHSSCMLTHVFLLPSIKTSAIMSWSNLRC